MITYYLFLLSLITFFTYGMDKLLAKKKMFRISEKILITLSIMGGFIGAILGMKIFKHKTKKIKFKIINIISIIIWCIILIKITTFE